VIRTLQQFAAASHGRLLGSDRDFTDVAIDSRRISSGELFAALRGDSVDGHQFVAAAAKAGAAGAIVQRQMKVDLPQIVVSDVEMAMTDAARAARAQFKAPVIGVAGSNGKTTVKEMLAAILSHLGPCLSTCGNLNNHLGVPMTLLRLADEHCSAVVEMGSNRRGDVEHLVSIARPGIGLITNAGAEHLEGFGSLEGAARAEGEMVAGLASTGTAVINADDAYASLWRASTTARIVSFGMRSEADFHASDIRLEADTDGFRTRFRLVSPLGEIDVSLGVAGRHNVLNALAASAAATAAGATLSDVATGLASLQAVKGRLQFKRARGGAWLIDDSYNANPSSARAALEVLSELPGRRWLVLGDMAELGAFAESSHREIGELAHALGVERLYAFGKLAALATQTFDAHTERFADAAALAQALNAAITPDVRLLIKGSRVNRLERVVDALVAGGTPQAAGKG
jgi:UDP-N-acetylmuramoyl-tripeptide--D-alanyl-D-alanine ligase